MRFDRFFLLLFLTKKERISRDDCIKRSENQSFTEKCKFAIDLIYSSEANDWQDEDTGEDSSHHPFPLPFLSIPLTFELSLRPFSPK
jgi:hypothetical protein